MGVFSRDKIQYQKRNTREDKREQKYTADYPRADQKWETIGLTFIYMHSLLWLLTAHGDAVKRLVN